MVRGPDRSKAQGRQQRALRLGLRAALALAAVAVCVGVPAAQQRPGGFVPLLDGTSLDGWAIENGTSDSFRLADGVLRVSGPAGWLRSERQYGDFTLRVEFRFLTPDADSGIFLRAPGPASNIFIRGWPANAYQVQVRDMSVNRSTNPYWIGNLYRHRVAPGPTTFVSEAAAGAVRATGEWQLLEIDADGDQIRAALNGVAVLEASGIVNPRGHIGVQGETGTLEYRRIDIRERVGAAQEATAAFGAASAAGCCW